MAAAPSTPRMRPDRRSLLVCLYAPVILIAVAPLPVRGQNRVYQKVVTPATSGATQFQNPTSLALAPDGRLFFAQRNGKIHYVTVNSDFQPLGEVGLIDTIYNLGPSTGGRTVTGMTFGPNGDLFVSHSDGRLYDTNVLTDSGMVTRLLARSGFTEYRHIVAGLPRAQTNHGPNGLAFGRDGKLYLAQGALTNAGLTCRDPFCIPSEHPFYQVAEQPFSAAILQIDVTLSSYVLYATGFRNPYDLLFHSNGQMYASDNGANPGSGERIVGGGSCAPSGVLPETPDELNLVLPNQYYGHPNQSRGECYFGDGPSQLPIATYGLHTSSNGIAEYTSAVMAAMRGEILTANWETGNVVSVKLSPTGTTAVEIRSLHEGLANPLDVVVRASDGAIFVAEYSVSNPALSAISVLRVQGPNDLNFDRVSDLVTWRPNNGSWYVQDPTTGTTTLAFPYVFGEPGDVPFIVNVLGNGHSSPAVYRSSTGEFHVADYGSIGGGQPGDIPVPADYDGDGRTDLALWRPSNGVWYVAYTATGGSAFSALYAFGQDGDTPFSIDIDGDGRATPAIYRRAGGEFHIAGYGMVPGGESDDIPVPADYDGDGRTDLALWRPSSGVWYVRYTAKPNATFLPLLALGEGSDIPIPLDKQGNGQATPAIFRPKTGEFQVTSKEIMRRVRQSDIPVRPLY